MGRGLCYPGLSLFCRQPLPVASCLVLCEPPLHKRVGGGAVLHFPLFPSSTSRLRTGGKRRFREDSVDAHEGREGSQDPLEAPRGPLHPLPNHSLQLLSGKGPALIPPGATRTPRWALPVISPAVVPITHLGHAPHASGFSCVGRAGPALKQRLDPEPGLSWKRRQRGLG